MTLRTTDLVNHLATKIALKKNQDVVDHIYMRVLRTEIIFAVL